MIRTDEDALICDLAETYHIYNYKELPINLVASFAYGLGESSRIKKKLNKQILSFNEMLLVALLDKVNILIWQNTKDGQKGIRQPESILAKLTNQNKEVVTAFKTVDDFEKERKRIIEERGIENGR